MREIKRGCTYSIIYSPRASNSLAIPIAAYVSKKKKKKTRSNTVAGKIFPPMIRAIPVKVVLDKLDI